ncbi:hypothetical protein ACGF5C_28955 [Micromonospora sp. NPDC047620]|uniref:hypothetical protein n=1 Tax=Micromonospora sp. NPDC047620 TaxID=3364251 RepID=UPI00371E9AF9
MSAEEDDEFEEVANILRGRTAVDAELRPAIEALEARLGQPVVALTCGSMNSVAGHGVPGVEVPTIAAWVRGAAPDHERRLQADAVFDQIVAEFGPWRWRQFTARALRVGNLPSSRARRIAALAGIEYTTDPILGGLGYFDEEATTRVMAAIPQERWDQFRDDWGASVWTVAVNADLHSVSVFVHTATQVAQLRQTPRWYEWERQLRALIAEEDEFGSTSITPVNIALKSRESFESDYQGNWSYYWY